MILQSNDPPSMENNNVKVMIKTVRVCYENHLTTALRKAMNLRNQYAEMSPRLSLTARQDIGSKLHSECDYDTCFDAAGITVSRQQWVFHESTRRSVINYAYSTHDIIALG